MKDNYFETYFSVFRSMISGSRCVLFLHQQCLWRHKCQISISSQNRWSTNSSKWCTLCMYQMFYEFCIQCNHDILGLCRKLEELYWWHKSHHKRLPSYTTRPSHPKTTYTFLMYVFIGHESDHWLCQGCVIFSTISNPRWDQPISDISIFFGLWAANIDA